MTGANKAPGHLLVRTALLRLRQRFDDLHGVQQFDLFGAVSRRLARFRKEQEDLLKQESRRRAEIRAMKRVRTDSIDAIGALVLIRET